MKLYFRNEHSETCHTIEYFQSDMKESGITEMDVFIAIPDKSYHHFWCKSFKCVCSKDDDFRCGKFCEKYLPCNGKSGRCRHMTHCYISDEKVSIFSNSI